MEGAIDIPTVELLRTGFSHGVYEDANAFVDQLRVSGIAADPLAADE
jgi:hypothetical protein